MQAKTLFQRAAGVETGVIEGFEYSDDDDALVLRCRVARKDEGRCPECGVACPSYDNGEGVRRWRTLPLGQLACVVEGPAPRVCCLQHGVIVAWVPWARHGSRFTRAFEDSVAWMAAHTNKQVVCDFFSLAWRSVGSIIERVSSEAQTLQDRFAGVTRIGIDEISHRKGHKYLVTVVDHDSGRLLWAAPGRDEATVQKFFDELGEDRTKAIRFVTCDAASWIHNAVKKRCPNAEICLDPFHIVQWATEALDEVRRDLWNEARRKGRRVLAKFFKGLRYPLLKNPENLTDKQTAKLSETARTHEPMYRAYLLKEVLREALRLNLDEGGAMLDEWLAWASRSRLAPFVKLAQRIRRHLKMIHNVLEHRLTNARVESMNTKIRLIIRMAFGFHSPEPLIGLAMLRLGGLCPDLPGRAASA
jgi:transposase